MRKPELLDEPEAEENLRSRTDARKERKGTEASLMRLATSLVELPLKTLDKLDLPESLLDVIGRARLVPDGGPKNRALRLVRIVLRDGDWTAIEEALREVHDPRRKPKPAVAGAVSKQEEWRARLVEGGDDALTAYVTAFPDADRQNLRQLVRNARKATEKTRASAMAALIRALRGAKPRPLDA